MHSIPDLPGAIRTLARIDAEGWLEDYEVEVANATRGPAADLDRYPQHRFQVGRLARIASRIFCLPIGQCIEAACEIFASSNTPRNRPGNSRGLRGAFGTAIYRGRCRAKAAG